jgi:hypothetical protein
VRRSGRCYSSRARGDRRGRDAGRGSPLRGIQPRILELTESKFPPDVATVNLRTRGFNHNGVVIMTSRGPCLTIVKQSPVSFRDKGRPGR